MKELKKKKYLFAHSNNDVGVAAKNVSLCEIDASVDMNSEQAMEVLHRVQRR